MTYGEVKDWKFYTVRDPESGQKKRKVRRERRSHENKSRFQSLGLVYDSSGLRVQVGVVVGTRGTFVQIEREDVEVNL